MNKNQTLEGNLIIRDNTVSCSNCGEVCGAVLDNDLIVLTKYRLTLDIPVELARVCEKTRPANRHRHNYEMTIKSFEVTSNADADHIQETTEMLLYSKILGGRPHKKFCRADSPCSDLIKKSTALSSNSIILAERSRKKFHRTDQSADGSRRKSQRIASASTSTTSISSSDENLSLKQLRDMNKRRTLHEEFALRGISSSKRLRRHEQPQSSTQISVKTEKTEQTDASKTQCLVNPSATTFVQPSTSRRYIEQMPMVMVPYDFFTNASHTMNAMSGMSTPMQPITSSLTPMNTQSLMTAYTMPNDMLHTNNFQTFTHMTAATDTPMYMNMNTSTTTCTNTMTTTSFDDRETVDHNLMTRSANFASTGAAHNCMVPPLNPNTTFINYHDNLPMILPMGQPLRQSASFDETQLLSTQTFNHPIEHTSNVMPNENLQQYVSNFSADDITVNANIGFGENEPIFPLSPGSSEFLNHYFESSK